MKQYLTGVFYVVMGASAVASPWLLENGANMVAESYGPKVADQFDAVRHNVSPLMHLTYNIGMVYRSAETAASLSAPSVPKPECP